LTDKLLKAIGAFCRPDKKGFRKIQMPVKRSVYGHLFFRAFQKNAFLINSVVSYSVSKSNMLVSKIGHAS